MYKVTSTAVGLLCIISASPAFSAYIEYTAGHADIRPVYENGQLTLKYRFDTNAILDGSSLASPELVDPGDAYVRVPDATLADSQDVFRCHNRN